MIGGRAGARLARTLAMPVSADTVLRLVRMLPLPQHDAPHVVGIDDWAIRKGRTYGTILVDLERRRVFDLLPDRSAETLSAWLREQPQITIITRDRATNTLVGPQPVPLRLRRLPIGGICCSTSARWSSAGWPGACSAAPAAARIRRTFGAAHPVFPRTRAEAAVSADSRARWLALYHEVQRRYAAGETLLGMSQSMGLGRSTVRKFAYADSFPERAIRRPVPACWTRSSNIWRRAWPKAARMGWPCGANCGSLDSKAIPDGFTSGCRSGARQRQEQCHICGSASKPGPRAGAAQTVDFSRK